MTIQTQAPSGGPDLSLQNPRDTSYVQSNDTGNNNTKEAFRFKITLDRNTGKNIVTLQARRLTGPGMQTFRDSSLKTGSGSVLVGPNLNISPTGGFIRTNNSAEINPQLFALIPEIKFDADGTAFLVTPFLDKMKLDPVLPGPAVPPDKINTTIGQICPAGTGRVVETIIHEAGSVGATADVQYTIYVGTDNTGPIIFDEPFAPSVFTANQPVIIFLDSSVVFEEGASIFLEMTSVNSFSLKTNAGGDVITSLDAHDFKVEIVSTDNRVVNSDGIPIINVDQRPIYASQF